jgi:tRNA(adenine34) deaminase
MQPLESLDHEKFMAEALREAEAALKRGDRPVGAVIVHHGKIVARGSNTFTTDRSHVAHAELKAILSCASYLHEYGPECVIYTTTEPCYMCLGAIVMANIRNIVFGMRDDLVGGQPLIRHVPHIRQRVHNYLGGVLEDRCINLCRRYSNVEAKQCPNGEQ